jgi:hypothetical protein
MEHNRNIPPRYAIRLDDLRAWHVIVATCAVCGKRTHIGAKLLQHAGRRTPGCSTSSASFAAAAAAIGKATP